jgi:L-alanine-DL-glutamate epimerase-like enolase superfamily enzyme
LAIRCEADPSSSNWLPPAWPAAGPDSRTEAQDRQLTMARAVDFEGPGSGRAARRALRVEIERWPLRKPFQITGHTMVDLEIVVVTLEENGATGRGEAAGVYFLDDDVTHMLGDIERVRDAIEAGADRSALHRLLPAGGARNALDCALWDLEAKRAGRPVWQLAGIDPPRPVITTYTLGAGSPEEMAEDATCFAEARALKVKLTGEPTDIARLCAVRAVRPDVSLRVDANQGFTRASLERLMPAFIEMRVELIEQPLPIGEEAALEGLDSPIPIAADECARETTDLAKLVGRFDAVNIKLDKCGGLTEGLAMWREAERLGLDTMVGNMVGTSLAMAPAFLLAQRCTHVDLDGPVLLRTDRTPGAVFDSGAIFCPETTWGGAT